MKLQTESNIPARLQKLKDATGLINKELAAIFGVDESTFKAWIHGDNMPAPDLRVALLRFECDNIVKLSPRLHPATVKAFQEGRWKLRA